MSLVTCSPSVVAQMFIFRTTVTRFSLDIRDIGSLLGAFDEPLEDQNWLQERILQGKWPSGLVPTQLEGRWTVYGLMSISNRL